MTAKSARDYRPFVTNVQDDPPNEELARAACLDALYEFDGVKKNRRRNETVLFEVD